MSPATAPRSPGDLRVLVVGDGDPRVASARDLPELLSAGDLVIVNDAATLPASIYARTSAREHVEVRLLGARGDDEREFHAALLGAGDWHTRTEDRPPPPPVRVSQKLVAGSLVIEVIALSPLSPRAVEIRFGIAGKPNATLAQIWAAIYRAGKPVQYAHVSRALALWDVQNVWASRPWAVEMPSAGRALTGSTLLALRRRGIEIAFVTHAAGISATGDRAIDAMLPLPERWQVPRETVLAVEATRRRGGRVIAVGTSVVRALESAARYGTLLPGRGVTDLRIGLQTTIRVADGILTGVHEEDTTHFALLGAFASRKQLDSALHTAVENGLLGHEFGDAWLVWRPEAIALRATLPAA